MDRFTDLTLKLTDHTELGRLSLLFHPEGVGGGTKHGGRQWYIRITDEDRNGDEDYSDEMCIDTSTMVAFCKAMLAYCEILEKEDKEQFM